MNSIQKRMALRVLLNLTVRALIIIPSGYTGWRVAALLHDSGGIW